MALTKNQLIEQLKADKVFVSLEQLTAAMRTGSFTAKMISESEDEYKRLKDQIVSLQSVEKLKETDESNPDKSSLTKTDPKSIEELNQSLRSNPTQVIDVTDTNQSDQSGSLLESLRDAVLAKSHRNLSMALVFDGAVTQETARLLTEHRSEIEKRRKESTETISAMLFGTNQDRDIIQEIQDRYGI